VVDADEAQPETSASSVHVSPARVQA